MLVFGSLEPDAGLLQKLGSRGIHCFFHCRLGGGRLCCSAFDGKIEVGGVDPGQDLPLFYIFPFPWSHEHDFARNEKRYVCRRVRRGNRPTHRYRFALLNVLNFSNSHGNGLAVRFLLLLIICTS